MPGVRLDPEPQTNLLYFTMEGWDTGVFVERLAAQGVLCFDEGRRRIRWVTHYGIERGDIEEALGRTRAVLAAGPPDRRAGPPDRRAGPPDRRAGP
jgi:hypothetical protein